MPWNGQGVFERVYDWTVDRDNSVPITASRVDTETAGIVAAINDLVQNNRSWTGQYTGANGTAAAPAFSFNDDPNTGMYRVSADVLGFAVNGAVAAQLSASGFTIGGVAAVTASGAQTLTNKTFSDSAIFTSPNGRAVLLESTFPALTWRETDGAVDEKSVRAEYNNNVFSLTQLNESNTFLRSVYQVGLSAAAVDFHRWFVGTVEKMRLIGTGLGIGIVPEVALHVHRDENQTGYAEIARFAVENNADGSELSRLLVGQRSINQMFLEASNQDNTKGDLLLQPFTGNVGIGTLAPDGPFHVASSGGISTYIEGGPTHDINLYFQQSGVDRALFGWDHSENALVVKDPQDAFAILAAFKAGGGFQLGGVDVYFEEVTIADDQFATITPPGRGGGNVYITAGGEGWGMRADYSGHIIADWGSSPFTLDGSKGVNLISDYTSGAPTGTTGVDGRIILFAGGTNGSFYLENRSGASRTFQIAVL